MNSCGLQGKLQAITTKEMAMLRKNISICGGDIMHKVQSPEKMEKVVYKAKPNGVADVWLRNNQHEIVQKMARQDMRLMRFFAG